MHIQFQTEHQYFFIHEHVKHLLLLWPKDQYTELYIIEEKDDTLYLRFPGETYRDVLLDQLQNVFFQRLETDTAQFRAALAATFTYDDGLFGAYYPAEQDETHPIDQLYFFEIRGDDILEIPDTQYGAVSEMFFQTFPEYSPT